MSFGKMTSKGLFEQLVIVKAHNKKLLIEIGKLQSEIDEGTYHHEEVKKLKEQVDTFTKSFKKKSCVRKELRLTEELVERQKLTIDILKSELRSDIVDILKEELKKLIL